MKNTIKLILLPIIYSITTSIVLLFVSYIYTGLNTYYLGYETNEQISSYLKSDSYAKGLNEFLDNNFVFIILLVFVLFMPYLYKKYKTYNLKEKKINFENSLLIIVLTMLVAGVANIIFYELNSIVYFTDIYKITDQNLIYTILATGIIGPIIEEYIFRGIIYNGLKKDYPVMTSIIFTSILFSILHTGIINMLYTFALSFLLIYVYEKYKTIKAPIIMHITSNTFIVLFVYTLNLNHIVNYILLIILIILLSLYYFKFIKKDLLKYKTKH